MKKLLMILPLVFLLCFTFSCQKAEEVAEEPAVDIEAETKAVTEAFWAMSEAGPAKDVEAFMSFLADDIVVTLSTLLDKEAIREYYTNFFSQGNYWTNQSLDKIVVSASGDLAYTTFGYKILRVVEGETSTSEGYNHTIWKKQADGSWKIVAF